MNRLGLTWAYPTPDEIERVLNLLSDKHPNDTYTARRYLKTYANTQRMKQQMGAA
jgi:hypothetical protein